MDTEQDPSNRSRRRRRGRHDMQCAKKPKWKSNHRDFNYSLSVRRRWPKFGCK